jgi:hypothetical protein
MQASKQSSKTSKASKASNAIYVIHLRIFSIVLVRKKLGRTMPRNPMTTVRIARIAQASTFTPQ